MQELTEAYSELGFVKQSLNGSSEMVTFQRDDGYEMFHHIPDNGIDLDLLISDVMNGLDNRDLVIRFLRELVLAIQFPSKS